MMTYRTLLLTQREGYAVVTMHRPREMNALSREMRGELGLQERDESDGWIGRKSR